VRRASVPSTARRQSKPEGLGAVEAGDLRIGMENSDLELEQE
jgi:hypothetical protein